MARILDFYAVRWEYEPHTFPILWNLDGDVVESFSPDFYLPDLDLYLEMTTLRQKLVRKKNRKLRRLRELYPSVNVKLFYARDFRALMLKYGKHALVDGLSGPPARWHPRRHRRSARAGAHDVGAAAASLPGPAVGASATSRCRRTAASAPAGTAAPPSLRRPVDDRPNASTSATTSPTSCSPRTQIAERVAELGARITADYAGRR